MGLHFSIGGYDYRWTPRFRQSIHCSRIQVLVADHVHWRSGIDNNFSFLRFQRWCKRAPIFLWREECCFFMLLEFYYIFGHLPRCFAGTFLLPLSPLETDPSNFEALGPRSGSSLGQIYPSEWFWCRILVWRAIAFVNFTRSIGLGMSVPFRRIDFGGFMSWKKQPNCRASDNWRLDEFWPNFLSLLFTGCPVRSWQASETDSLSCPSSR